MKWKDTTAYSQGSQKREPRTWTATTASGFQIHVTRLRDYDPDVWILVCYHDLRIVDHPLLSKSISDAKKEAVVYLQNHLKKLVAAVDEIATFD